jgi:hypothetical protein
VSHWLRWWYPGPRWTPETLDSPARERRERELALEREVMRSRLMLLHMAEMDRIRSAIEAIEHRLAALEEWRKQEDAWPITD